jgi:glutaredoxin 3
MNIRIYTKANCPNCVSAKQLLKSKGLEYEEVKTDASEATRFAFFSEYPDVKQMPFILINNQRVGGFAGLQAALKQVGL